MEMKKTDGDENEKLREMEIKKNEDVEVHPRFIFCY